jgi:ubiquinone/menaquinone biosynthesis C-methylase UbiE
VFSTVLNPPLLALKKAMQANYFENKEKIFDRWALNYDFLLTTVFYQAVHKRLLDYVRLPERAQVLDLGCGTGRLLNRLAAQFSDLQGTGLDLSSQMLRQARQTNLHHPRLIFVRGNAEFLSFAEGQFDAVFNTISFLHYSHPDRVLAQVSRVLKSSGYFYLVDWMWRGGSFMPLTRAGINFYTPQQREKLGRDAQLKCMGHYHLLGDILLTIFSTN